MESLLNELNRRLAAVTSRPRGFQFWKEVRSYVELIKANPMCAAILEDSQLERHEQFRGARQALQKQIDGSRIVTTQTIHPKGGLIIQEKRTTTIFADTIKHARVHFKKTTDLQDEGNIFANLHLALTVHDAVEALTKVATKPTLPKHHNAKSESIDMPAEHAIYALMARQKKEHVCEPLLEASLVLELADVRDGIWFSNFKLRHIAKHTVVGIQRAHSLLVSEIAKRELAGTPAQTSRNGESANAETKVSHSEEKISDIDAAVLKKMENAQSWEQVRFEFCGDGTSVEVLVQAESAGKYNFEELGFKKKSTSEWKPVNSWRMLHVMALSEGSYKYSGSDLHTKKDLSEKLRDLFPHLNGEPIECDSEEKTYRSRIVLSDKTDSRASYMESRAGAKPREFLR